MTDTISLTGVVATTPRHVTTTEGLDITSFRLASSQRRFDRKQQTWVDMGTNWYTITAFRQLASNLATSIQKGDRVVAAGRMRVREWEKGDRSGTTVEVEAETVGHDLTWGSAVFTKTLGGDSGSAPRERDSSGSSFPGNGSNFTGNEWAVPGTSVPTGADSGDDGGGGGGVEVGRGDPYLPADHAA